MRAQVLDEMQRCKQRMEDNALKARCISRVNEMKTVIHKYRRTLHPHDFYPSMEDVGQIPDFREAIVNGTDEEFNACVEEVIVGLPELTSRILEERTAKVLALLPSDGKQNNVLSLATVWFTCGPVVYGRRFMDGTEVLQHRDLVSRSWTPGTHIGEETFDRHVMGQRWQAIKSKFSFSEAASTIARGLILDCGEDPESITSAEMDSKLYRFAVHENGRLTVNDWREAVRVNRHLPSRVTYAHLPDRVQISHPPRALSISRTE